MAPSLSNRRLLALKQWSWAYVAAMACALIGYRVGPAWMRSGVAFNAIGGSSGLVIVLGARRNLPGRRLGWYLFALSLGLFVAGDVVAYNYHFFFGIDLPFPSLADVFYLAVYPVFIAGVLLLIHQRNPARDSSSMIDALVVTIAAAAASWLYLMAPYAHDATLGLPTKLISIAYPMMDILVLGVVVRLAVGAGRRGTAFRLLLGGVGALVATDSIYGWKLLHGGYEPGELLDVGWGVFYALAGAAALHPSMRHLSEPAPDPDLTLTRGRLTTLALASLTVPALIAIRSAFGETFGVTMLAIVAGLLFTLIVGRMAGLVLYHEAAEQRAGALHRASELLVLAGDREAVLAGATTSAQLLAPSASVAHIYTIDEVHEHLVPLESTHAGAVGGPMALDDLPAPARVALADGDIVTLSDLDRRGAVFGSGMRTATLFPLMVQTELWGVLLLATAKPLKRPVAAGLSTLSATVTLALEGVARADEAADRRADARLSSLSRNASDVVCVLAPDTTIQYVSPSVERVLGYREDESTGLKLATLVHHDDFARVESFLATLATTRPQSRAAPTEFRLRHAAEGWATVEALGTNLLEDATVGGLLLNIRDVSDRKLFEGQLEHQAFHDTLTGLPNRALFRNRVEHALARRRHSDDSIAVMFFDLDDFKTVNDGLGHAAGDQLLIEIAHRMAGVLRIVDTPARLGGDEFAVLLDASRDELHALEAADRILDTISQPVVLDGRQVAVRASIGIAFSTGETQGAVGAETLLRNADVAMYHAKDQGKGIYQVFEPEMHAATLARLEMKADLERALHAGEFTLRYQPIMDLPTDSISGFEALVRWDHPDRGTISPIDFIPLAEETGLIVPLGRHVLDEACRQAKTLQAQHPQDPPLSMSVNLSARQIQRPELCDEVRSALETSGVSPDSLILEITESAMMEDIDVAVMRLRELRTIGVRLAIDDFGTGHCSLNYIRQFPVSILKIDKSFLWNACNDEQISAMTTAIVDLARILGLKSTAEGIEDAQQLDLLNELGCDLGQGYLFAKPLTGGGAQALLASAGSATVGEGILAASSDHLDRPSRTSAAV